MQLHLYKAMRQITGMQEVLYQRRPRQTLRGASSLTAAANPALPSAGGPAGTARYGRTAALLLYI